MILIYKLFKLNIKYKLNMLFHSYSRLLGKESQEVNLQIHNINWLYVTLSYILWLSLSFCIQLFINEIKISEQKFNMIITFYIIFCSTLFFNSKSSKEFTYFFMNGNFERHIKKKLLFINEISNIVINLLLILIVSIPFFLLHPILNGLLGLSLILHIILIIICISIIITYINIALDLFGSQSMNHQKNSLLHFCTYMILILYIVFHSNITHFIKKLNFENLNLNFWNDISGFFIYLNFYHMNLYTYIIMTFTILSFPYICDSLIDKSLKNNYDFKITFTNILTINNKYFLLLKSIYRRFHIINFDFLLILFLCTLELLLIENWILFLTILLFLNSSIINKLFKNNSDELLLLTYLYSKKSILVNTLWLYVQIQAILIIALTIFTLNLKIDIQFLMIFCSYIITSYFLLIFSCLFYNYLFKFYGEFVPFVLIRYLIFILIALFSLSTKFIGISIPFLILQIILVLMIQYINLLKERQYV